MFLDEPKIHSEEQMNFFFLHSGVSRSDGQAYAQRTAHTVDCFKPWMGPRPEGFIQGLPGHAGSFGDIGHTPSASGDTKRMRQFGRITILDHDRQVGSNILFGFQLSGKVELGKTRDMFFIFHSSTLKSGRNYYRTMNMLIRNRSITQFQDQ